jgi:2-keto-4-pentenoate hydratase
VMTDQDGKELGRAKGSALMDNPINSVMWLAQDVAKHGMRMQPGDKLSLGGFIPPTPTQPGLSVKVQYLGLPQDPSVSVTFK